MKKILIVFMALLSIATKAQEGHIAIELLEHIAYENARSLWGDVHADNPIPLYNIDDQLIAYTVNFSIGEPFPERESLEESCDRLSKTEDKHSRWLIGSFGHMLISATSATIPIVRYSKTVSDEYAYGTRVKQLAMDHLKTDGVNLERIYLVSDLIKWYCFASAEGKAYVKFFPPIEVYSEDEFKNLVPEKYHKGGRWQLPQDNNNYWDAFKNGHLLNSRSNTLVPHAEQYIPFYDWSYGCTPTAFAMALAYWDNLGMISANKYGNLVKHHFQRYDHVENETDKNVPDLQKALAIAMETDSMTGNTHMCCWLSGFLAEASARGYSFSGQDKYGTSAQYLSWAQTEINNGRPYHLGTPFHSNTGVGYTSGDFLIRHNTWWPGLDYVHYTTCDLVGTIIPGGSYGASVQVVSPYGDPRYSDDVSPPSEGEFLYAGDAFEVSWDRDIIANTYTRLLYSTNGGLNWAVITNSTTNNGKYDWRIPSWISSSSLGRVKVEIRQASTGTLLASDGSWGNFDFVAGGSLPVLTHHIAVNTTNVPHYYQFTNTGNYWNVVGIRRNNTTDNWDIELHGSTSFNDVIAQSNYTGGTVDFVVIGDNTPVMARGIKAVRNSGIGTARVEFEGGADMIGVNSPLTGNWLSGNVVKIWDVYLTPGPYSFFLDINSGSADLDFALYGKDSSPYYAGRHAHKAISSSGGPGIGEQFSYNVTTAGWYGLCVWANNSNHANFTIRVVESPGTWKGFVSTNWHNPENWSTNLVPHGSIDVTIPPGAPYFPIVSTGTANCKTLTVNTGALLTIGGQTLNIAENLTVHGTLAMNNASGALNVSGDVVWGPGSTANFTAAAPFRVYRDWTFQSGSNANLTNGTVLFQSATNTLIRSYSSTSSFNNLGSYKTDGAKTYISVVSTQPLTVNNYIYVHPGSTLEILSNQDIILKGDLNSNGAFICLAGKVVLNGHNQSLRMNFGNYFNNLTFNQSGTVTINNSLSDLLDVRGNVVIQSGVFNMQDRIMHVRGNWTNYNFPAGFNAGTGRVIFKGTGNQTVNSSENFNILEADLGGNIIVNNAAHTVTCNRYHWTSGGIDVIAGIFTALDLTQNGLYGGFQVKPGGTINITNSSFPNWVDLYGSVNVLGGTMNIDGLDAWWPYDNGANFTMTGGVLDFKTCELTIYDSYSWTNNVSGGTIRTSMGFQGNRADFTPTGGTLELYGSTDYSISQSNGSTLHHVRISKSAKDGGQDHIKGHMYDERSGGFVSDGSRANTISLGSNITITGNLDIDAGTFSVGQYTCNIAGNINISGTLAMTQASGVINATGNVVWNHGSTANFTALNVFNVWGHWNFESGSNANLGNGVVAFRGPGLSFVRSYSSTSSFYNISSYKTAPAELRISSLSTQPLTINGYIYVHPEAKLGIYTNQNVILKGNVNSNGDFICNFGTVVLNGTNQSLRMNTGNYFNHVTFNQSGSVTINNSLSNILDVRGNVVIQTGVFSMQDRIIHVGGNWTNNAGTTAFNEGTGRVVFNGNGAQTCNSETFNILEVNKTSGTLNLPGTTVCAVYDWTGGGITANGGTFTAHGLAQNGIFGSFMVNNYGTINLYQDNTQFVDLLANISIHSGTMNIYGGIPGSDSWWPGISASEYFLTMSGGVLDFKDQTIFIRNGGNLTANITGGTIRTSKSYVGERPDFMPAAGTFELYGPDNAHIILANGSTLHNLVINKSGGDGKKTMAVTGRDGRPIENVRDNLVTAFSDLTLTNVLTVNSGELSFNGYDAYMGGNVSVNAGGTLTVNNNATLLMSAFKRLAVNNMGNLRVIGSEGSKATVSLSGTGNYLFDVESGGTLSARHAIFEHMNMNGIVIKPGSVIDPDHAFANCNFRNGTAGGRLLTIHNNQEFTVTGAQFPANTWGGSYNVYKNLDQGRVTFVDYTGDFAGSAHEFDPYHRVNWGEPYLLVSPETRDVGAHAGATTFEIESNRAWTSTESVPWFSVAPMSGGGDGTLIVSYNENTSLSPRSGQLTISASGVPDVIATVNQAGFESDVPLNRYVVNESITDGKAECYDAWQSIVVQNVIVESGGAAYFVAGESIVLLPGTQAKAGSYLHAWITTTEEFCSSVTLPLVAAKKVAPMPLKEEKRPMEITTSKSHNKAFIRIYPNPTPGLFTLELLDHKQNHEVVVHIFSMRGTLLQQHASTGDRELYFDLSDQPSGVYFLRVMAGSRVEVRRVIKHGH